MKFTIYNLILAVIGLVIVYIIYLDYLGSSNLEDSEGFEEEHINNNTPYSEGFEEDSPDTTDAVSPDNAQSKLEVLPAETGDDYKKEEENPGFFTNIYNYFFNTESFMTEPSYTPRNKWYQYEKYRGGGWKSERAAGRQRHWDAHVAGDASYNAAKKQYNLDMDKWNRWKAARARAAARVAARAAAKAAAAKAAKIAKAKQDLKPYLQKWDTARRHLPNIRNYLNWHNRVDKNRNAQFRANGDANTDYNVSLRKHHYWNYPYWKRQGKWADSANRVTLHKYWKPRVTSSGKLLKQEWGYSGNYHNTLRNISKKAKDKRRRDALARKANTKRANWRSLERKAKNKLGPLNTSNRGRVNPAFMTNLRTVYGLNQHLNYWTTRKITDGHKLIDDEYNKIMQARIQEQRKRMHLAYVQATAARNAANQSDAAAKALAEAETRMRAADAAASSKRARSTARAVNNMTNTLRSTESAVQGGGKGVNKYVYGSGSNSMNGVNATVLKAGDGSKQAINDLITIQKNKLSSFKAVPMDAIKEISLKARQNYNKAQNA